MSVRSIPFHPSSSANRRTKTVGSMTHVLAHNGYIDRAANTCRRGSEPSILPAPVQCVVMCEVGPSSHANVFFDVTGVQDAVRDTDDAIACCENCGARTMALDVVLRSSQIPWFRNCSRRNPSAQCHTVPRPRKQSKRQIAHVFSGLSE